MKAIILAAGQSLNLDGYHQLLVCDPKTKKNILDNYIEIFDAENITVVIGYRAVEIMSQYPSLTYIYNKNWAVTNNGGSLGLLDLAQPGFVLSSDFFISAELIDKMEQQPGNTILTAHRAERGSNAFNCQIRNGHVTDIYKGRVKRLTDPETLGVFKIADVNIMSKWIKKCRNNPEKFVAQNLEFSPESPIKNFDIGEELFYEINSVSDYINFIERRMECE